MLPAQQHHWLEEPVLRFVPRESCTLTASPSRCREGGSWASPAPHLGPELQQPTPDSTPTSPPEAAVHTSASRPTKCLLSQGPRPNSKADPGSPAICVSPRHPQVGISASLAPQPSSDNEKHLLPAIGCARGSRVPGKVLLGADHPQSQGSGLPSQVSCHAWRTPCPGASGGGGHTANHLGNNQVLQADPPCLFFLLWTGIPEPGSRAQQLPK